MTERNNRERPAAPRHDSSANPPAASTPSSFLSRVFRGSTSRSSTSDQPLPTSSSATSHHGDAPRNRPTLSPSVTPSSSGPSPGMSPVLFPQASVSGVGRRTRSKSPNRARHRLHDISTQGITNFSLQEGEDEDAGPTSVGILRHLSQTSRAGVSREPTMSRPTPRNTDHTSLRNLINMLVHEDGDNSSNSYSNAIISSHLSNHERASLAVELAGELKSRMEDFNIERRLQASLADDPHTSASKHPSSADLDPLARLVSSAMGHDVDTSRLVDRLMNLPPRLIADGDRTKQSAGQNLKTAGFQLLAALLQIQAGDALKSDISASSEESQGQTRFRSSLIELCLSSPIDMPAQAMGTTLATCEYAIGDLPDRIACLQVLTRHGRDITLNQNIVRTLVKWHMMLLVGWKAWCAEPESWESTVTLDAFTASESRGRRDEPVASNERDRSNSTITIQLPKESMAIPEDSNAPVIVRSLRDVWYLLVAIISHNLPLFSGKDIEIVIDMAVAMLEQGIEVTSLNSAPPAASATEAQPSVAKAENSASASSVTGSRARSGSLLSKNRMLKVPAPPPTTSDTGVNQASTILSRSPSIKTRDSRGVPPVSAAPSDCKFAIVAGTSGSIPPWSRVLSPVLDLLRFLLQAKYLPPTSLVSVIQLLALCYGWRSDARGDSVPARSIEASASIINNLDSAGRTQIEQFFRDLFASKLVSRNAERCLRNVLGGNVKIKENSEYEQKTEFKRDVIVGALGYVDCYLLEEPFSQLCYRLTRVLLQTTYTAAQEKNVHAHELSPNFNLQSLAPTLLASMSNGDEDPNDSMNRCADVDIQVLCIVDDYLTDLSCTTMAVSDIEASTVSLDTRQSSSRDPWYEGHLVCQFLQRGLALAKGSE